MYIPPPNRQVLSESFMNLPQLIFWTHKSMAVIIALTSTSRMYQVHHRNARRTLCARHRRRLVGWRRWGWISHDIRTPRTRMMSQGVALLGTMNESIQSHRGHLRIGVLSTPRTLIACQTRKQTFLYTIHSVHRDKRFSAISVRFLFLSGVQSAQRDYMDIMYPTLFHALGRYICIPVLRFNSTIRDVCS